MTMGQSERKKELLAAYKERPVTGGVYAIRCLPTGCLFLYCSPDPRGQQNRFDFSVSTGTCVHACLATDWRVHGSGAFTFAVLESLEKPLEQTQPAFLADLAALTDAWREKLTGEGEALY